MNEQSSSNQSAIGSAIEVTNIVWEGQKGSSGALEYRFTIKNKTTKPIFAIKYVVDFSGPYAPLYSEEHYAPNAILGNEGRVLYNTTYLPWDARNGFVKIGIRVLAYEFLQNWDEARRR
jgi:hypothetical protein